ncbi:translation initiation factor eIF-2B subunit delta-like [Rhodamnia argentea]|uniref:Translation initiation factor eIF2B subunit delta n=1 Tax=Rhodamnia argentea TaxID=178133 RepID=A0A8B8PCF6_9MYRT|nr:translation initiation factor eIF-2B subunit delta-like [Rhodamnia argentea]
MDPRRTPNAASKPKVRQVGFVPRNAPPEPPARAPSYPAEPSSPPLSDSPAGNSLSPVMIPPPRHLSDNISTFRTPAVPVPESTRRRAYHSPVVGSYDPAESLLGTSSPVPSPPSSGRLIGDGEFSEESWLRRSNSAKFASSFPGGGFDLTAVKAVSAADLASSVNLKKTVASDVNVEKTIEKSEGSALEVNNEAIPSSKPLKAKPTKSERRALQESQRAAKAAARAEGNKSTAAASGGVASVKVSKQRTQKKAVASAAPSVAASEKKGSDRALEKDRKKDAPAPRMQFDEKSRVEKAKRRAVVNQTEARNRVELFRHLPEYEQGTQLADLESKFFQLEPIHPAVYKVGLQFLAGDITGGNARCIAMLQAFQEAIKDYVTPPEKTLNRDLTAKISSYVSFFTECRPLSISMGNAIRFIKNRIAKLAVSLSESEAKASLCSDIDRFINEKIIVADQVIVRHAATKIRDGDVLLTYGASCVVEMILLYAHENGKQFRVVVIDSRPKLEGQSLLRRLIAKGLSCTYTHINAVSYIMHEVTGVFLGASSVLSNGTVYSRVGTASVAMVANAFRVPVIICCEAYKFHERVQLDSICFNELGDPDAVIKVPGRMDVNYLGSLRNKENLQLLNLMYDATPSEYVSMIITDYGMIPPTSVPVIVREYRREQLWI